MVRLRLERRRACDATRVRGAAEGAKIASGSARIDADVGAVANAAFAAASLRARAKRRSAATQKRGHVRVQRRLRHRRGGYPRGTLRPEDVVADDAVSTLDPRARANTDAEDDGGGSHAVQSKRRRGVFERERVR